MHIISGGNDAEQRRDGDYLNHDERYARTDAFTDTVRKVWTAEQPVDIDNDFYQAEQAWSAIRPLQQPHIPIYFGGSSEAAIAVAGKHADVFALWGESLGQTAETIRRVRAEAAKHQRHIDFSVSFRPIIADSEAQAREGRAYFTCRFRTGGAGGRGFKAKPDSEGARRLRATAEQGNVVDKRLWTGIAKLVGGGHNSTALVGTAEQVADALLDYYDLGVRNFLIRGFDPLNDAREYGKALLPIAREKRLSVRFRSAHRDAFRSTAPRPQADWLRQLTHIRQQMAEQAAELDRSGDFPHHNLALLHQSGFLSLATPAQYGGAGGGFGPAAAGDYRHCVGEPATALIVCMQYLHHLRLAESDGWVEPLRRQVYRDAVERGD